MASWVSNGIQSGSAGDHTPYLSGTQSVQFIHDTFAANGDTITIPAGNVIWSSTLTITKGITLQGTTMWTGGGGSEAQGYTTLTGSVIQNNAARLMHLTSNASSSVILSQLAIKTGTGNATEFILTDGGSSHPIICSKCYFEMGTTGTSRFFDWNSLGGIFSNCTIWAGPPDSGANTTNVNFCRIKHQSVKPWSDASTQGMLDVNGNINLYFEDCKFYNLTSQCIDMDDGARSVVRHCQIFDTGSTAHGCDTSQIGARHMEYYDNTFTFTLGNNGGSTRDANFYPINLSWWYFARGGTFTCTRNSIPNISSGWWGNKSTWRAGDWAITRGMNLPAVIPADSDSNPNASNCWIGGYPSPEQVGWGSNGSTVTSGYTMASEPVYVWNNTIGSNANTMDLDDFTDNCAHGNTTAAFFQSGRDYFLGIAKPGYTSFTYPHPLLGGSPDTNPPTQPQNLSATTLSSTAINLRWDTSTDLETSSASLVYDLERKTGAGSFATVPGGGSIPGVASGQITFGDTGLNPGINYVYEVRAIDSSSNASVFSATANATTSSIATAPLFVQSATDSGLPLTATFASPQAAGNANVVVIGWQDNLATVATVSDAPGGNTYVLAGAATGQGLSQSIYIAKNIAGPVSSNVVTVTFTGTPFLPDLRIAEYSGADLVTPLESITSSSGTTNAASCGPLVLTGTNDLLFSAETATISPVAAGATFTQRSISAQGNITEDKGLSTTGSFSSSFTFGSLATPIMVQHVSSGTNSNAAYKPGTGNAGNNFKFFLPNVVRLNNCVILCISNPFSAGRTITITDNIGTNTWGLIRSVNNGVQMTSVYMSDGTAAGTQRITVTFDTNLYDVHIDATEFYNVATTSAVDVSNGAATSATSTISAGSIITTAANDLVYQVGFDTAHLNLNPPPSITNMTNSAGFTFLNADIMNGQFVQYGVVAAVGSITPSVTLTGSTDAFNTITIALKSASAGTAPPATGIRISSIYHVNMMRAVPMIVPSRGNLLYFTTAFGSGNQIVSGVSDSVNGTWTVVPAVAGGSGNGNPQCYYRINATPSNTRTMTVSGNTVSLFTQTSFLVYDILNATAAPFDTSTSGANTFSVGAVSYGTIVPTTSNGLVIATMATYWDALTAETNAAHTFDSFTYTNLKDADLMENVDGYAHFYNPTAASVTFNWTLTTASLPPNDTSSTEQYTIAAFKGT